MGRNFRVWAWRLYTDGACKKLSTFDSFGFGGWCYAIVDNHETVTHMGHGSVNETTSQRMELTAMAEGLEYIESIKARDEIVDVYSDSAYVINCYIKEWYKTWETNGWLTTKKLPVQNKDLWKRIIPFFKRKTYNFYKVEGHSGVVFNEQCDDIAQREAERAKVKWRGDNSNVR